MYKSSYVLGVALLLVLLSTCCRAYEERPDFCIETEPMLLADIKRQMVAPLQNQSKCNITATLLTPNEKERLYDTICADHGSLTIKRSNHHFFKLLNGELYGRGEQNDICKGGVDSVLAWVPYKIMMQNYATELNPSERLSYIAKATSVEREKTELCHFRHTDLVNNVMDSLFTCVVMIFEDNFYGIDDSINVLVELQPVMYQLRNITYQPWRNITNSYKMRLGDGVLKNPSAQRKPIYGSLSYAYVEKIRLNTSSFYNDDQLEKLPLLLEHRGAMVELDIDGVGGIDVQEQAFFGRTMDARSEVKVQVIGQWMDLHREISADLYNYYGFGLQHYRQHISGVQLTFVRIDDTEPAFESPESNNLVKASLFRDMDSAPARMSVNGSAVFTEWEAEHQQADDSFYPWFVISCLLFGIIVLILVYGIVRVYNKKTKERQKYELANTSSTQANAA
ncbi:PREDICTED: uncharacterized protein LOC108616465 [Drosophila arizonae]|uniref:Uncharacterized protein LOC108616465 n=1 Tax=Drosophila arizonae TaxID=7263 RepID=A0ABM1PIX1_DROAR|nr:PREDICTED: uncharacterized protein LOC108616465 [Drosophila arizonae]